MMTDKVKRIISQIINNCQFPRTDKLNNGEKDSFYKKFPFANGHIVEVRVSNHKTDLNTWATRKYEDGMPDIRISIVFQDSDAENVVLLHAPIKRPINVNEFVYDMKPENSIISDREIGGVSKQIMGLPSALSFNDPTHFGISGTSLTSINQTENNQEIKENRNMNKKQVVRINENQLRQIVTESVKKVLNEISIDTLQRAQDKAFDEYDSMWPDDEDYDEDLRNKRERQYNAFKDRIHQLKSQGGKKVFYIVKPGMSGFYNGEVRKVYMTPDEAKQYSEQHDGNIYTDFVQAKKAADYLD